MFTQVGAQLPLGRRRGSAQGLTLTPTPTPTLTLTLTPTLTLTLTLTLTRTLYPNQAALKAALAALGTAGAAHVAVVEARGPVRLDNFSR